VSGVPDPPLPFTGGRIPASDEERALVERRILRHFILIPALAVAVFLAGFNLGWPLAAAAGVIALALDAVWIGALAVQERRLMFIRGGSMTRREYRYFIYEGVAAVPYGLSYLLGGVCLLALALLFVTGVSLDQMRAGALARPGRALIPLGAALLCYGLGFLIGFTHRSGPWWQRAFGMLIDAPGRLGGLILVIWATAALGVGLVEQISPGLFLQWFERVFGNPWPWADLGIR
jgi:hypothetical protein